MRTTYLLVSALLCGNIYAQSSNADSEERLKKLESRLAAAETAINGEAELTRAQYKALLELHDSADRFTKQSILKLSRSDRPAICNFFEPDLNVAKSPNGFSFYIQPGKIESVGDSVRLYFRIGNPYAAQFTSTIVTITFGKPAPAKLEGRELAQLKGKDFLETIKLGEKLEQEWRRSLRTLNGQNIENLTGGGWTEHSILIPQASPSDFRHVELSLWPNGVSLARER